MTAAGSKDGGSKLAILVAAKAWGCLQEGTFPGSAKAITKPINNTITARTAHLWLASMQIAAHPWSTVTSNRPVDDRARM